MSFWLLISVSWLSDCGLKHHAHALHNVTVCVFQQFSVPKAKSIPGDIIDQGCHNPPVAIKTLGGNLDI